MPKWMVGQLRLKCHDLIRSLVRVVEREVAGASHRCACADRAPTRHGDALLARCGEVGRDGELLPLGEVDVGYTGGSGCGVEDGLLIGGGKHELGDGRHGRRGRRDGRTGGRRSIWNRE
jgi:hypothetical protein